jgi:hypothetical protein
LPQDYGLFLVTMEPSANDEAEFHDWYDTEHIPERKRVPGFLTTSRWVCLDGWPRYLALYDLANLDVLAGADYQAISGDNFSPWSTRIRARMHGRYTAVAQQIHPGTATTGANGPCSRLVLLRFRNLPTEHAEGLLEKVLGAYGSGAGVLQARLFHYDGGPVFDRLVLVEMNGLVPALDVSRLGETSRSLDLVNIYAPYWRAEPRLIPGQKPA